MCLHLKDGGSVSPVEGESEKYESLAVGPYWSAVAAESERPPTLRLDDQPVAAHVLVERHSVRHNDKQNHTYK